jgi:hypothetical protein
LGFPHGFLARDHNAWIRSSQAIKRLQRIFKATLVFGHDLDVANALLSKKKYFE